MFRFNIFGDRLSEFAENSNAACDGVTSHAASLYQSLAFRNNPESRYVGGVAAGLLICHEIDRVTVCLASAALWFRSWHGRLDSACARFIRMLATLRRRATSLRSVAKRAYASSFLGARTGRESIWLASALSNCSLDG